MYPDDFRHSDSPSSVLEEILEQLRVESGANSLTELTKDLHIYPDFHGLSPR